MPLHILKMAVGCDGVEDLREKVIGTRGAHPGLNDWLFLKQRGLDVDRDDVVLVVAPTHPLANREVVKLDEMLQFPLLLLKQGRQRTQLNNFFQLHDVQPRIAMELDSSELLKRLICAELGMGFLPHANVLDDEHSGLLKIVKVEGMKLHRELALIFRKDKTLTRAAQAFLEIATGRNAAPVYPPMRIPKGTNLARGA